MALGFHHNGASGQFAYANHPAASAARRARIAQLLAASDEEMNQNALVQRIERKAATARDALAQALAGGLPFYVLTAE